MQTQWLEKNVDLNLLAKHIRPFFPETDYEATVEKINGGYMIQAISKIPDFNLEISVTILGRPNDFIVEFSTGGRGGHFSPSMIAGDLTTMFGGGILVSRGAQKHEALDMLEKDFWRHTQMQVADLAGSATQTKTRNKTSQ